MYCDKRVIHVPKSLLNFGRWGKDFLYIHLTYERTYCIICFVHIMNMVSLYDALYEMSIH